MPFAPRKNSFRLLPYGWLAPFLALMVYGLIILYGWVAGKLVLVQPRSYDADLPANAGVCLVFIGLAPLALTLGWQRMGVGLGAVTALLAGATLFAGPLGLNHGLDNLLINHETLVAGSHTGRMPAALATVFLLTGLLLVWLGWRPIDDRRPIVIALLGSLCGAYGLTGLLGFRVGLYEVESWQIYARLGPHTAVMLLGLSAALLLLAARDGAKTGEGPPRWLWLPVVVGGATLTFTFWFALLQREHNYTNTTTQLTSNNIAALFSGESEAHILSLTRMARRWTNTPNLTREEWEAEATEYLRDFAGYRSIAWVDESLHARWFWPQAGNEDAPHYNHAADPLRRAAIARAREALGTTIAAPLDSPLQPPTFAVYATILRGPTTHGFIVGEFFYDKFFDVIDRRLNLSRRYQFTVTVSLPPTSPGSPDELKVYETMTPEEPTGEHLRQTISYTLNGQRLTISLAPRPIYLNSNRQYLPELALFSGLGLSALFGLVVNLAQTARRRLQAAERTSELLRMENEERRRVESRLKATDERLNLALESTQLGVYEWDVATDHVFCTPSVWKIIGYDPGSMPATFTGWLGLLHDEDQPFVRQVVDAHFRGETPYIEIEHCVLHQNGEWIWIALRAKCTAFSAAKQPRRVIGTIQNINVRKRADEALRASQAETRKLSLVASKTDNAVILTDSHGHIEWVNTSYSRLTGCKLQQVAQQPLVALLTSPEHDPAAIDRIQLALSEGEPVTTDAVQLAADGRRIHVRLDLQPVINQERVVENFIVMETDMTARVELEQSLRRAKADADAASHAKSDFLATMSHEIRTPMNGVIGMTSLLLDTELTAEQRDFVSTIRTSGDALLAIINEILDFSKIESGKMELEKQPFELAQCLEEAVDIFALQAAGKNIELAYHIHPAVPHCVLGDITRLRQVLVNLISNAVKFTPQGFITVEVLAGTGLGPGAPADQFRLNFIVTDTGIGIPPERLNLLFQPFSQVDSSMTRKYGGTGLGLAICDRLCQLMGGSIGVESTPGQGSRFHFSILTSAYDLTDAGAPPLFAPIPSGNVLAVDDHPFNRTILRDALLQWDLTPLLAATPDEALAVIGNTRLAAAVIDQDLAGLPSAGLLSQLRTARPSLPIILLTPATEGARPDDPSDPLIQRLPKPIKPYHLHEILRRVITNTDPGDSTPPMPIEAGALLADTIPLDILLVEDNLVNQKVALRYLQRLGYRADAVVNGLEAVQAMRTRNYRLVFMDVQMPEMDGYLATKAIRAAHPAEHQPIIIALTANAMQGDRERCLAAGMNDYISKPVRSEEIAAVITRLFGPKTDGAA